MSQPVRGLNRRGLRPTLVVLDDPEDEENTKTAERMQANARWLFQAVEPSLDPEIGRLVVIGTPQNTQCLVVALHDSFHGKRDQGKASVWFENDEATGTSRWSVDPSGPVELGPRDALEEDDRGRWVRKPDVLWPEWFSLERLRAKKRTAEETEGVGVGVYYREYECKVVGDEEQLFRPDFFALTWSGTLERDLLDQPYVRVTAVHGEPDVTVDDPLLLPCSVSLGLDPAFSTSQTADRTALVPLATTYSEERGEEVWELPGVYSRFHHSDLLGIVAAKHKALRPDRALADAVGAQVVILEDLREQHRVRFIPDTDVTRKKGDGSRIARLEGPMNPSNTFCQWRHRPGSPLRTELLSYPRGHDDYADAAEKAFRCRRRPAHRDLVLDDDELRRRASGQSAHVVDPMTV